MGSNAVEDSVGDCKIQEVKKPYIRNQAVINIFEYGLVVILLKPR